MNTCVSGFRNLEGGLLKRSSNLDTEPLNQSCFERIGAQIISMARIIQAIEPVVLFFLLLTAAAVDALAQAPSGNIFGSDQQVGNAIREAIKWGRNLLFLMGVVFVGWGVVNFGTDKPSAKQFIAAIGCFAFGGIVALVYSISQGNAVNLDTGFGN
jgi:hypothetical protein